MLKSALVFVSGLSCGLLATSAWHAQEGQKVQTVADFPDLGRGLLETKGCLGITSFPAQGGKQQVIAAWFENRKAMEAWYYSPMHQGAMAKFFPNFRPRKPFAAFKDEKAPILVLASVTPSNKPIGNGSNLAVSQIAIEGYTPIPGGLALGGTFSPEKLAVPGLVRIKNTAP